MDQRDHHNAFVSVPMKRKRGRPRKYPVVGTAENAPSQRDPSLSTKKSVNPQGNHNVNHKENASVPPGFKTPIGNQPSEGNSVQGANDIMVGQIVSGVVEAVFDAGCMLNVRVGDSRTTLRGVVFKPGTYVPVSAENDVAPNVQMISRKEIPFPSANAAQVQGHSSQAKEKNSQLGSLPNYGTAQPPNKFSSDGVSKITNLNVNASISRNEQTPSVSKAANLSSAGGDMLAIVSQLSQVASQTAHPTTLGYLVASSSHPPNVSASTSSQPKALLAGCVSVNKSQAQKSSDTCENEAIAPLQAVESIHHNYSAAVPSSMSSRDNRTDKMSELLRVLQDNFDDNQTT